MLEKRPGTILIVDDEPDIRSTLERYLTRHDYTVLTAENGVHAMMILENHPVDLMMTDMRMPEMDGLELLHRTKELDEDIMTIVLTGHASVENAIGAMKENGAYNYLQKPIADFDHFDMVLKKAMEFRRIRLENQYLIRELSAEKEALLEANRRIQSEMDERLAAEQELKKLASTDSLTGVMNRRVFLEHARSEILRARRYGTPFSLALMDIDRFKSVNDTYGHMTGDHALTKVAGNTVQAVREVDSVGRVGGEEFGILLVGTSLEDAVIAGERIRESIRDLVIQHNSQAVNITVSIGIAGLEEGDESIDDIIERADRALYAAKDAGRDRVRTSPNRAG